MSLTEFLEKPFYELQLYKSEPPQDAVSFIGAPRQHPYDDGKIILITRMAGDAKALFEFRAGDIVYAEDLPTPVTEGGESFRMVKLWVRRGSIGLRYEPFEVAEPLRYMNEFANPKGSSSAKI